VAADRQRRGQEFASDVAAVAARSLDELNARLARVEEFRDLFLRGGARALEVGDRDYRRHLAQVVAGGLRNDVPLDRAALLLDLMAQVDAKHLTVLQVLARAASGGRTGYDPTWSPTPERVATSARTDLDTAVALLARLRALGLAESHANVRRVIPGAASMRRSERWWPTRLGANSWRNSTGCRLPTWSLVNGVGSTPGRGWLGAPGGESAGPGQRGR
jgi:hypothetical protein